MLLPRPADPRALIPDRDGLRPTSFSLGGRGRRFLFFDAFVKDRRLTLVSTYYPDVRFDFREVEVAIDGRRLERFEEIGRNEYEPTRAVFFPLGDLPPRPLHQLLVRYRGEAREASIAPEPVAPRRRFTVATLFKDDWVNLETFVRYYRGQGVERFYLFYNGPLPAVRSRLPAGDDLIYGEWDFLYWLGAEAFRPPLADPEAHRNNHHAQTAFLTMVRHRYLAGCSFLALIDLDEFLFVPGETLRAHVERIDAKTLTARSHWTEVRRHERWVPQKLWKMRSFRIALRLRQWVRRTVQGWTRAGIQEPALAYEDLGRVWANVRTEGTERVKTVYRHDYEGLFAIHAPKPPAPIRYSEDLALHHLVNTSHGRYTRIHAEARLLSLIGDAGRGPSQTVDSR